MNQFSSVVQLCPTLCDPMDCSTPGFSVHHQLPESTQTHVHWVGDAIQPSHSLLSPSPIFNLSQHQGLFQWVSVTQLFHFSSPLLEIFIHWKDWCWSWNSNTLATWCEELAHLKRPLCWERLRARGEGYDRGWDGWMASPTWWIWVWVNSGSWWWTGRPGVLQSMGLQRVGHNWVTELN